jgi:TrmH family RNA methyltransferase
MKAVVRLVLVRPGSPENVGASARIVKNTGLEGLDLVAPGDWRTVDCWRTAWGAQEVLEQARELPDLAAAVAQASYVVGLSGRRGATPVLDVREAAQEIGALGPGERAALVLGPETTGLTLDELALCGKRARIPSHPDQPSLNLSHAAMVMAYEVFRAGHRPEPAPRLATHLEKEHMLALLREGLLAAGALPPENTDGFFREWRSLFSRADLTPKEVRLLEHLARKLAHVPGHDGGP